MKCTLITGVLAISAIVLVTTAVYLPVARSRPVCPSSRHYIVWSRTQSRDPVSSRIIILYAETENLDLLGLDNGVYVP